MFPVVRKIEGPAFQKWLKAVGMRDAPLQPQKAGTLTSLCFLLLKFNVIPTKV